MVLLAILIPSATFRATVVGLITLSLILPRNFPPKIGTQVGNWISRNAMKYFGVKVIIEDEESFVKYYSHEDPEHNRAIIFATGEQLTIYEFIFRLFLYLRFLLLK